MKNYSIRLYQPADFEVWNAFVVTARNATFLFNRGFMEYHSDRFTDYSLMVWDADRLVAILPANRIQDTVVSHQGLTYGGLLYGQKTKLADVIIIFQQLLVFLNQNGINKLKLKLVPSVYHRMPSQEVEYVLFLLQARLLKRDSMSVIDLSEPAVISKKRLSEVKKGYDNQLEIREEQDFTLFWEQILIPTLAKKHEAEPVHSLEEIRLLKSRFPNNIRQFNVYYNQEIVAGSTIFETDTVAHSQYIAGNSYNSKYGSLDFLYEHLITNVFAAKRFFDFGISNEAQGKVLNSGLSFWKESFGAGTVVHDFYEVETGSYSKLDTVFK